MIGKLICGGVGNSTLRGDALGDPAARKLSLGYVYDVVKTGPITWGVGALASTYDVPGPLKQTYGAHPTSWMGFVQARF